MSRANPRAGARDMVLTMAVLMIPVLLIVWFFQRSPDEPPLPRVDWKQTVTKAEAEAPFTVMAPDALPEKWRVTQASWRKAGSSAQGQGPAAHDELRLGMLNADNLNLQVRQANPKNVSGYLADHTRKPFESGALKVGDDVWKVLTAADGRTTYLVLQRSDSVVMVSGDTEAEQLKPLAELLKPAK